MYLARMGYIARLLRYCVVVSSGCSAIDFPDESRDSGVEGSLPAAGGGIDLSDVESSPPQPYSAACKVRPPPNSSDRLEKKGNGDKTNNTIIAEVGDGGAGSDPEPESRSRCGCDGTYYATEKDALNSGAQLDPYNHCTIDKMHFGCGEQACLINSQGCRTVNSHANDQKVFSCFDLPEMCVNLSHSQRPCVCFQQSLGDDYFGSCDQTSTAEGWTLYLNVFVGP
jgi:hypothetical protein